MPPDGAALEAELLEVAVEAARAAGAELLARWRRPLDVGTKSTPTDPVTEADVSAERAIRDVIGRHRPSDSILGEEGGETGDGALRWVVDPLDGTVNYLYRFPAWSTSVAAEIDGVVVAGAVHDPLRGETFSASRGGGAFLRSGGAGDAVRLAVTQVDDLARALIGTGFAYDAEVRRRQGRVVAGLLPVVRDIRRAGSAALDLCWVGAGRLDGFYEEGPRHWDRAAGGLVAAEAGAWIGDLEGGPPSDAMTVAAGPGIAPALVDLISRLVGETDPAP